MDTELRERIVVDGAEAAAGKLSMLAGAAGRVAQSFHGMTEIAGSVLGIAGLWKVAETVHEVDRLYQSIIRVKDMTGLAADHAHAMFDMFELSGIGMESAERIITSMTRKGATLQDGIAGVGASTQHLTALMTRLGVAVKAGPEDRIFAMAKAAQQGKLDISQLIQAFGIPRGQAAAMMSMLKQGPEKLKAIQKDTMTGADVIDDRTLETYRNMLQVRRELGDAWGDLVNVFYKNLIPAVTKILQEIKSGFDSIAPVAATIGKFLSDHMTLVVGLAKTYLALLIASKAVNLFSSPEGKMGVFGRGKQLFGGAMGFMGRKSAAAGAMDYFEARAAGGGAPSMFGKLGGMLGGGKAVSGGVDLFATAGGPLIRIISSVAGRLGIIGAVVGIVVVAFEMLKKNVFGLRDAFGGSFMRIWGSLKEIISKVISVLDMMWNAVKPLVEVIAGAVLFALLGLSYVVEGLVKVLEWAMDAIQWSVSIGPLGILKDWLGNGDDGPKALAEDGKRGAGDAPASSTYQDFRGSKFDINNNFPPGIDGGRVAVAFGDELAQLGERRLDSGVRPLFSYR